MKFGFLGIAVFAGVLNPLLGGTNAMPAKTIGQPIWAVAATFAAAMAAALAAGLVVGQPFPGIAGIAQAPWWNWRGGLSAAGSVLSLTLVADNLGASVFTGVTATVAMPVAVVLDHCRTLGFAMHKASALRVIGGIIMTGGLALILRSQACRPRRTGRPAATNTRSFSMPDTHAAPSPEAVSRNPATGEVIEHFPFQTKEEVAQLLREADGAFHVWRAMPIRERADIYSKFTDTLLARKDQIAPVITAEMGKILKDSVAEVEKCAATAQWFAEHGPGLLADEPVQVEGGDKVYVSYLPLGSILGIMPWNFPLWQAIRACVPIMLSGNGFILKPAPNTMRCGYLVRDAWEAAGLPKGLFSVLNTDNEGTKAVLDDHRVAGVSLTGSLRAGSAVASQAGKLIKKSLLELGGADPFIVLADADIDKAVAAGILARFSNTGQICLNAKRFILEKPIAKEFTARFVEAAGKLKMGDPHDPATTQGPIARSDLRDGIHDQVTRSLASGATLLLGGHKVDGPGYFYEPTVLSDVEPGMAAFDEEIFGPVAALTVARDAEHAIELANCSDLGLSGNLWTADLAKAQLIARRLETGGVFINGFTSSNPIIPVGGIKNSGYGRELSHFGVREFTNPQAVWVKQA